MFYRHEPVFHVQKQGLSKSAEVFYTKFQTWKARGQEHERLGRPREPGMT